MVSTAANAGRPRMEMLVASVLHYALWPGLTLAMLALWIAAILDIDRHRRMGASTSARLACMACCVSVAAIAAIAWGSVLFATQWAEAVSNTEPTAGWTDTFEDEGSAPTAIFSFGLERASYPASGLAEEGAKDR